MIPSEEQRFHVAAAVPTTILGIVVLWYAVLPDWQERPKLNRMVPSPSLASTFDISALKRLEHGASRCASLIPGWFHAWDLYTHAARHAQEFDAPLLVEVGSYLGMSACFMSHVMRSGLLGRAHMTSSFHVIDKWYDEGLARWAPPSDMQALQQFGAGSSQRTWQHFMRATGAEAGIARVRRSASDAADLLGEYAERSIAFLYLDTSHSYNWTAVELRLWWPKLAWGGWLCGDD